MTQGKKRFYGTLAVIALVSGMTGAFAVSVAQKSENREMVSSEVQKALYGGSWPSVSTCATHRRSSLSEMIPSPTG